jgi:Uma2 family endonuclease
MAVTLRQRLDYDDYAAIPPDRNRHELIDGTLHVTPAPDPIHQRVSRRLQRILEDHCDERRIGEVFNAPIDLILTPHDVVQPDLLVVADPAQVSRRGIEGPPLLVVEVLSGSTARHDRIVKAGRYAALGVPHYWVVDPEAQRIECSRLAGAGYARTAEADSPATFPPPDWPGLAIALSDLFR